jgi:hypothetical protein
MRLRPTLCAESTHISHDRFHHVNTAGSDDPNGDNAIAAGRRGGTLASSGLSALARPEFGEKHVGAEGQVAAQNCCKYVSGAVRATA